MTCKTTDEDGHDFKYEDDEYGGLSGGGDYEIYRCKNCRKKIYVELPD